MLHRYIILETLLRESRTALRARRGERGATAVEYGLMVALIAVAIITTVTLLGGNLNTMFGLVKDELPTTVP